MGGGSSVRRRVVARWAGVHVSDIILIGIKGRHKGDDVRARARWLAAGRRGSVIVDMIRCTPFL